MGEDGHGPPVVLDAGALIALERGDRSVAHILKLALRVHIPAGALAQTWRDPSRQAVIARLLSAEGTIVHPLDENAAKLAGRLCAATGTSDVVDASVANLARRLRALTLTSDPGDLRRLAPDLPILGI